MIKGIVDKVCKDLVDSEINSNEISFLVKFLKNEVGLSVTIEEVINLNNDVIKEEVYIRNVKNKTILYLVYKGDNLLSCVYNLKDCINYGSDLFKCFREEIRVMNNRIEDLVTVNHDLDLEFNRVDQSGDLYDQRITFESNSDDVEGLIDDVIDWYSRLLYLDFLMVFSQEEIKSLDFLDRFLEDDFIIKVLN